MNKKQKKLISTLLFILSFLWLSSFAGEQVFASDVANERPTSSGVRGDANGDGIVTVRDLIRMKVELSSSQKLATEDALMHNKTYLQDVDLVSLCEILLRRGYQKGDIPLYMNDRQIMLAAYEGPEMTQEGFEKFRNAGLNTVYAQGDAAFNSYSVMGSRGHWRLLDEYMSYAETADVDVIVYSEALVSYLRATDAKYGEDVKATVEELAAGKLKEDLSELWNGTTINGTHYRGMKERSNFAGLMMADELPYKYFENYAYATEIIRGISPDIACKNSQLSMEVEDAEYLCGTADTGHYTVQERWTNFKFAADSFGKAAGEFVYDMYPLRDADAKNGIKYLWFYNLQALAEAGRDGGYETGLTIQSHGFDAYNLRTPQTEADIGFQVYTGLAYGMKSFTYYTYGKNSFTDEACNIETNAALYQAVKNVNNRIDLFDHVYQEFDWKGSIIKRDGNTNEALKYSSFLYGSFDMETISAYQDEHIEEYVTSGASLVGCMYDEIHDADGYWIVNATNPYDEQEVTVTIKWRDVSKLMIYHPQEAGFDGNARIEPYDVNEGYTINLPAGAGVFVIPLI